LSIRSGRTDWPLVTSLIVAVGDLVLNVVRTAVWKNFDPSVRIVRDFIRPAAIWASEV